VLQVVADPLAQLPAGVVRPRHQQHVTAGEIGGHVCPAGFFHGFFAGAAADAAVLVVVGQHGGIAGAEPQAGFPLPSGGEADGVGELGVLQLAGE
jgi:hypothetical protein